MHISMMGYDKKKYISNLIESDSANKNYFL